MANVDGKKIGSSIHIDDEAIVKKFFALSQEKNATMNAVGLAIVKLGIAAVEAKRGGPIPTDGIKRSTKVHTVEL